MKKIIFVVVGIVSVVMFGLFINSCAQEKAFERKHEKTEAVAYAELHEQIALLNAQYAESQNPETRGRFLNFLRNLAKVVGCDIICTGIGATMGAPLAIPCGLYGSGMAAIVIWGSGFYVPIPKPDDVDYVRDIIEDIPVIEGPVPVPYNIIDSVGYFHNRLLSEIFDEVDSIYTKTTSEFRDIVYNKCTTVYGEMSRTNSLSYFLLQNRLNAVIDVFMDDECETPYEALCELEPAYQSEFMVLKEFNSTVVTLADADMVREYTSTFSSLVENAQIPEASKNLIKIGAGVGGNSALLWGGEVEEAIGVGSGSGTDEP